MLLSFTYKENLFESSYRASKSEERKEKCVIFEAIDTFLLDKCLVSWDMIRADVLHVPWMHLVLGRVQNTCRTCRIWTRPLT